MYRSGVVGVKKRRLQIVPPTTFHRVPYNSMEDVKDVHRDSPYWESSGSKGNLNPNPPMDGVRTAEGG